MSNGTYLNLPIKDGRVLTGVEGVRVEFKVEEELLG